MQATYQRPASNNLTEINMSTKQERKSIIGHEVTAEGIITFSVVGAGQFQFDPARCTDEVERMATLHGYVQKISDKAAIQRDPATGLSATPKAKYERMYALAKHLMEGGAWVSKAAGKPGLNRAVLFAAIAAVRQVAPEKVAAKFQSHSDEVLRTLLTHRDIAAEYARLSTPEAGSEAVDGMLEELGVE